jgi:hypothetical protein
MTWGLAVSTTVTVAAARVPLRTFSASASEIFWMIEDLFKPVPAAGAPAFWTKKTSSAEGDLVSRVARLELRAKSTRSSDVASFSYHTTASWKIGSVSEVAIKVRDGLVPITS